MNELNGQIAVVTGAGSGIGRAIALALAAHGATICLVGRRRQPLEETAAAAGAARCYQADLADDEQLRLLIAELRHDVPAIDILVHSAAYYAQGRIEESSVTEFDRLYRVNLRAPYALTQGLLDLIRERHGQVVFLNSSAGLASKAALGQYAASKHGLKAIADSLRAEVNGDGVRVLSVYPGRTASPMQAQIHAIDAREYQPERLMQPEDVAAVVLSTLLLPRTAEVTDIQLRPLAK